MYAVNSSISIHKATIRIENISFFICTPLYKYMDKQNIIMIVIIGFKNEGMIIRYEDIICQNIYSPQKMYPVLLCSFGAKNIPKYIFIITMAILQFKQFNIPFRILLSIIQLLY